MRVDKLYEGQVFKNYRVMCEELEMPIRGGNSKKLQMEDLHRYCATDRSGNSIIVREVFDFPIPKIDGRGRSVKPISLHSPALALEWDTGKNEGCVDSIGRASEELFWWTCNTCKMNIYDSPRSRLRGVAKNETPNCLYCSLSLGARSVADHLAQKNIKYTTEKTTDGLVGVNGGLLRFDFAVLDESNIPLYFIEYDGAQHFSPTSFTGSDAKKEFIELSIHDRRKNKYCEKHDISLIRVYYFEDGSIDRKLSESIDVIDKGGTVIHRTPFEVSKSDLKEIEREIVRQQKEIDKTYSKAEERVLRLRSNIAKLEQRKEALSSSIRDDSL